MNFAFGERDGIIGVLCDGGDLWVKDRSSLSTPKAGNSEGDVNDSFFTMSDRAEYKDGKKREKNVTDGVTGGV